MGSTKDGGANPPISTVRNIMDSLMKKSQGTFLQGMLYFVLAQHTNGWVFWTLTFFGVGTIIISLSEAVKENLNAK